MDAPTMEIHQLTKSELDEAIKLWAEHGKSHHKKADGRRATFLQHSRNPDFFWGASEKGRLIGVLIASHDGRIGWIDRIAVEPMYVGRGIVQAMIRSAEKYLKGKNIRRFCLLVGASNLKLHQELQKSGYLIDDDLLFMYRRSKTREAKAVPGERENDSDDDNGDDGSD